MKNINKKLLEITKDIGIVKKTGYNDHQKYHYPTEQDILDAIRPQLIQKNVGHIWSVVEHSFSENYQFAVVVTEHTFTDLDSGESVAIRSVGTGTDKQDKAIYKADTGANKYALAKLFMIATNDDPENDGVTEKSPSISSSGGLGGGLGSAKKSVDRPTPTKKTNTIGKPKAVKNEPQVKEAPPAGGGAFGATAAKTEAPKTSFAGNSKPQAVVPTTQAVTSNQTVPQEEIFNDDDTDGEAF